MDYIELALSQFSRLPVEKKLIIIIHFTYLCIVLCALLCSFMPFQDIILTMISTGIIFHKNFHDFSNQTIFKFIRLILYIVFFDTN